MRKNEILGFIIIFLKNNIQQYIDTKKKKIIAIILSVVSVMLCATIVFLTVASCSEGDSNGKTVVKKVIKKNNKAK